MGFTQAILRRVITTTTTRQASTTCRSHSTTKDVKLSSLALSVYFKHPEFDMEDYEILSRSSAFLLSVDPLEDDVEGPYGHLEKAEEERKLKEFKRKHSFTPAMGGADDVKDMGWLQFVPKEHRPNVHCVCSSHVVSPFLWKDYYPQPWLGQVRQEHCRYELQIFDPSSPEIPRGTYDLHNSPIHHPEGRDIAFLHLKDEEQILKEIKAHGVKIHHFRDPEKLYKKGETMYFEGFVVKEEITDEDNAVTTSSESSLDGGFDDEEEDDDTRIFIPYNETGILQFHTKDRFFASTPKPLPEGLCGAPALDEDYDLCGIVEGIVPVDHDNPDIAGSAAFLPSFVMTHFVDYAERFMVEQMMPKDIFQQVVRAKTTNSLGGGVFNVSKDGADNSPGDWDQAYARLQEDMKKKYSKEEYDAIMWNVKREREEVLEILDKEGGDLDEIINQVRARTVATKEMVMEEYKKGNIPSADEEGSGFDGQKGKDK